MCCGRICMLCTCLLLVVIAIGFLFGFGVFKDGFHKIHDSVNLQCDPRFGCSEDVGRRGYGFPAPAEGKPTSEATEIPVRRRRSQTDDYKMRITVMTTGEQIITLDVDSQEIVENVKALLEVESNVPIQQQQLLYNGNEMRNSDKLSSLGVKDDDLLMMVSNASAGSPARSDLTMNPDGSASNSAALQQHIITLSSLSLEQLHPPHTEIQNLRANSESSVIPFPIMSLPQDIIVDIIARVERCDDPTLSLVSKRFRSTVSSPELHARRSLLGRTEHRLYVLLDDYRTSKKCFYVLHNRRLVPIPTLPTKGSFVAAGSKIYVFGEDIAYSRTAVSIECTSQSQSHTVKTLPSMPYMLTGAASIIDGKIYVSGNCDYDGDEVSMVVFNTETQMWEAEIIEPDIEVGPMIWSSLMMAGKIYIMDYRSSVFYDPKERTWGRDQMLDSKKWRVKGACVVDDVLYYYDEDENCLRTYDPKKRCWGVVNGLDDLLAQTIGSKGSETVSYSGKLALFFLKEAVRGNGIWFAEISLERRQGGEIWGQVERCHQVLSIEGRCAFKSLPVEL
ncbi:unnamed protein product [Microthlaspi erraticum]|uniref:F-box domain-containing protein n=1 Tax=Microthlaspi erraticum TaxID=1685480 RepID=A0A6D2HT05_9BRAS|nr:unnamed protein product [Microthlaspi erraticum]